MILSKIIIVKEEVIIMNKLHLIMPMAGGGTRFGNKGFDLPKPLIGLHGKPFFYWATQSINMFAEVKDIIFIVLQEHVDTFKINEEIRKYYPDAIIRVIPKVLNGAVLTCCEGLVEINDEMPILFNDCDHAFYCKEFYEFADAGYCEDIDGALLTFFSDSPRYSFVMFDESNNVCGTIEKEVVSNEAICGAYYFKNKEIFKEAVSIYLNNCSYSEYFVSGVYNEMVKKDKRIRTFKTDKHVSFGTPDEYEEALHKLDFFVHL